LIKLNPYAASLKRRAIKEQAASVARRNAITAAKRDGKKLPAGKVADLKKKIPNVGSGASVLGL
jgi:hypothetical protein